MNLDTLFPSDYLKAADILQPRMMTIRAIKLEEIGQDKTSKPVLFFSEETRGMVLNKTNAAMIAHTYGNETDSWLGRPVELHVEPVQFQGRVVDAIRVSIPPPPAPAHVAVPPAVTPPTVQSAIVATQASVVPVGAPVAAAPATNESINDDVDF
jgi:hypothetical protein